MFASIPGKEPAKFGRSVDEPLQKAGVALVNEVGDLAVDCGCVDESGKPVKPFALPWQAFAKVDKEPWCLRIESPAFHSVNGENVFGCAWSFSLMGSERHPNR